MTFLNETIFKSPLKTTLALLFPAFVLFAKTLSFDFTSFDEQWLIFQNAPFIAKWSSIIDAFTKPMTASYYRPFLVLSFIVDYHLGKLSPGIYHVTNLWLHLASVYLLFKFLLSCDVDKKTAFLSSLLFSVHPLILHATVWVPGRNDLILSVFSLLSLIHLNNFITQSNIKFFVLHLLFFCCSLFTKENAVVLPLVFLVVYAIRSRLKNKMFYLCLFAWIVLSVLFLQLRNHVIPISTFSISAKGTQDFFLAFIQFIGKTILPFNQSILPKTNTLSVLIGFGSIAMLIFIVAKFGFKAKKLALLGLFIYVVLLIIPVWFGAFKSSGEHYEHRAYTSLAGFMLFLSQLKFDIGSRRFQFIFLCIFLLFFIKSFKRTNIYKNPTTYIDTGLKERPDFYLFYQQKSQNLYKARKYIETLPLLNKAITLRPDKAELYANRGSSEFMLGMYREAIDDLNTAIAKSNFRIEYYLNRCMVYNKIGDVENALKDYAILKQYYGDKIPVSLQKALNDKWETYNKK